MESEGLVRRLVERVTHCILDKMAYSRLVVSKHLMKYKFKAMSTLLHNGHVVLIWPFVEDQSGQCARGEMILVGKRVIYLIDLPDQST